jgi:hypothetical protein
MVSSLFTQLGQLRSSGTEKLPPVCRHSPELDSTGTQCFIGEDRRVKRFKGVLPVVTTAGLLVVAAFVLGVIAIILSFAWRWQTLLPRNLRKQNAVQPDTAMNGLQTFEAAVEASNEARRARLARQERVRKILTPVAFGLSGLPVIFALAALFWAGDREAAIVCVMTATISLGYTTVAHVFAKHGRQKVSHSALQADQSL